MNQPLSSARRRYCGLVSKAVCARGAKNSNVRSRGDAQRDGRPDGPSQGAVWPNGRLGWSLAGRRCMLMATGCVPILRTKC
jgi:hypothetical protein